MTGRRYLLLLARQPAALPRCKGRLSACTAAAALKTIVDDETMLLLGAPPFLAADENMILLGSLFQSGVEAPVGALGAAAREAAQGSRGRTLIDRFWGGYVAVLRDPARGRVDILRSPLGDLPCYFAARAGIVAAASDIELLAASGACDTLPDWAAIARHLAAPDIRRPETCLAGVSELPGGQRLTLEDSGSAVETLWSPWDFALPERRIDDPAEAARRVRDAARHCVAARASEFEHILLKLSGGLDSSIVAACLARSGRPFACMTLVTEDPSGDERSYARMAAAACGAPLIERHRDVSTILLERSAAARLPRPTARSFTQESVRLASEAAVQVGAGAVFDGGGGDNIFCSLQSVRPLVDHFRSGAPPRAVLGTAADIALLSEASLWTVLRRGLVARWRGLSAYRWAADHRLLSRDARALTAGGIDHPWLRAPPGALPGKAAHIALVAAAQSVVEGTDPQEKLPTLSPLVAQPLVEACIRIPSWLWFGGGLNRAVARNAFAADLPETIVRRRSKGGPDSFIAEIFERNRGTIRTMLLEGALAQAGLLDVLAVAAALDDDGPVRGHQFLRLMQLADTEAWARSWLDGRSAG